MRSRKIKGRLKVCSSSLVFDPQDISEPMIKFPFRSTVGIVALKQGLRSVQDVFSITSDRVDEMLENNIVKPYIVKKVLFVVFLVLFVAKLCFLGPERVPLRTQLCHDERLSPIRPRTSRLLQAPLFRTRSRPIKVHHKRPLLCLFH